MGDAPPESEDWYRPTVWLGGLLVGLGALVAVSGLLAALVSASVGSAPFLPTQSVSPPDLIGAAVSALSQVTGLGLGTPLILLGAVFSGTGAFLLLSAWQVRQRSRDTWPRP